jgi:hypothetical protein
MAEQGSGAVDASELELQRSSQEFLGELGRLDQMERRKQTMSPSDDQRGPLAHEIEDAAIGLVGLSRYQTRLVAMEQQALGGDGRRARRAADILDEWRAAEGQLRDARAAMEHATDRADQLREEHRRSLRSGTE